MNGPGRADGWLLEVPLPLEDSSSLIVATVLWCTGFHSRYERLEVPGAPWQRTLDTSIIHGVNADARLCAERILAA